MACDHQTLARSLPTVVANARRLVDAGHHAGPALFVRAAVTACLTIKPFGYVDLSARCSERAQLVAAQSDDPADAAAAAYAAAQTALASGTVGGRRRSLSTAVAAAERLGDVGTDSTAENGEPDRAPQYARQVNQPEIAMLDLW